MFRKLATIAFVLLAYGNTLAAQTATTEETIAWEAAKESRASADVFAFIENYPDGVFAKEAKEHMIDLLWVELSATQPTSEAELIVERIPVTFSQPLTEGSPDIIGKSLEELIVGSPLFPPVEGLPEEYWKEQECSNCHEWKQANLCTQANTYLSDAGADNLIKQHPYGGSFKLNLRDWAAGGCE